MTPEEKICAFCEPKPKPIHGNLGPHGSKELWWRWGRRYLGLSSPQRETPVEYGWLPRVLDLDALREVESRLNEDQWFAYELKFGWIPFEGVICTRGRVMLNASVEQKISALAAVLPEPPVK